MHTHAFKKQRAAILIISMIMLAVISGLGLSAMSIAVNEQKSSDHFNKYLEAKERAHAAIPYAIDAIEEWGIFKGSWLAIKRVIRCNPWWGTFGEDPVPKKK